jgi:DNA mismatch repair protein MutS
MTTKMIDDYFKIYKESVEEFGIKTVLMYVCGKFYECYSVNNKTEQVGNAEIIADVINCVFTSKNKAKKLKEIYSTRSNPDFVGFGVDYKDKYFSVLIKAGYTIIQVDQTENSKDTKKGNLVKREITDILSPSLNPPEYEMGDGYNDNILMNILVESIELKNSIKFYYSICTVNNTTNEINIYESSIMMKKGQSFQIFLDELTRVLLRYNILELNLKTLNLNKNSFNILTNFLNESYPNSSNRSIMLDSYDLYIKVNYQNEYFKKVYNNIDFGLLSPIEYLNLDNKQLSIINFMYTCDFIARHNLRYLLNITVPKVLDEFNHLNLALNTLSQLHIINGSKTVFDIINFTTTRIGYRALKTLLCSPFKNVDEINYRYELSEKLQKSTNIKEIDNKLSKVIDFVRLHRKMNLNSLNPSEFEKLTNVYSIVLELNNLTKNSIIELNCNDLLLFNEYNISYRKTFNLELLCNFSLNTNMTDYVNFFNKDVIPELDKIELNIKLIEKNIEDIRIFYDKHIHTDTDTQRSQNIKLEYTDQDGYYLSCTKIRFGKLSKTLKDFNSLKTRNTSNIVKFYPEKLTKYSLDLINNRELLVRKVKMNYFRVLSDYSNKYNTLFKSFQTYIELLDITNSNVKCANKYNYSRPIIINSANQTSFVNAKKIRHPIIERICHTEYVTNDILLNSKNPGMLLYGLNSSGKSSLLRSLGVNILLAQAGLYVPCAEFEYYPFDTIICQVDLTDDLFKGKSSFINEMIGLRKILTCTSSNTLVLSDELCKGTEPYSAQAIVSSSIVSLINTNTKFFFTSHLHGISKLLKDECKVNICHLSVDINKTSENEITFNRILKPGSGNDLYGLEVAKSIIQDIFFIDKAFEFRNTIIGESSNIISNKKSNYNKKKIVDCCQVCNFKPKNGEIPLETHHINEQHTADSNGFVISSNKDKFHKNQIYNLVVLCKDCHHKIDTKELEISGYKQTTKGLVLVKRSFLNH